MEMVNKPKVNILRFGIAIAIPLLVGGFSAFLTSEDMQAYDVMNQPLLAPPRIVFPVMWTILYILMGIASYFVYESDAEPEKKRNALLFYAAQLIMNFFWSTLFFTYGYYLIALLWLLVMWVLVLICTFDFYRIYRPAGIMMGILSVWTTFAAYLNLSCYMLSVSPGSIAW